MVDLSMQDDMQRHHLQARGRVLLDIEYWSVRAELPFWEWKYISRTTSGLPLPPSTTCPFACMIPHVQEQSQTAEFGRHRRLCIRKKSPVDMEQATMASWYDDML
jgi:hypothetical protein